MAERTFGSISRLKRVRVVVDGQLPRLPALECGVRLEVDGRA